MHLQMYIFSLSKNTKFIVFARISEQINTCKTVDETKKVINFIEAMLKRPFIPCIE